jgi:hypothetical protein
VGDELFDESIGEDEEEPDEVADTEEHDDTESESKRARKPKAEE